MGVGGWGLRGGSESNDTTYPTRRVEWPQVEPTSAGANIPLTKFSLSEASLLFVEVKSVAATTK